jgi:riboflavin synthase
MFTGLIEGTGTLVGVESRGKDLRLSVRSSFDLPGLEVGESIAVDGVCLTVVSFRERTFTLDVSQETSSRTTLAHRRQGDTVNLERALRVGDRLGGHLVSAHVDGTARVKSRKTRGESLVFEFAAPASLLRYLIEKGSVTVNGVSLTVNRCDSRGFEVNVVPHTARVTTMGNLKVGDEVNVEVDQIGKFVEKFLRNLQESRAQSGGGLDREFLARHGLP